MQRKSQAALEFLMTYGWAIAIILGTLATLAYVGVFDFNSLVSERCDFSSSIICIDGIATTSGVTVSLRNAMVIPIEDIKVYIPQCSPTQATGPTSMNPGDSGDFTVSCDLPARTLFRGTVLFNYTNTDSGYEHIKHGRIIYRVYQ